MTLTEAAGITKKGVVIGFISAAVGIFLLISYNVSYQYYLSTRPKPEDQPGLKFGVLPAFLPPSKTSSATFTYSIDTVTGGFPQSPKVLPVYFIPRGGVSLLAPDKYKQEAADLGFTQGPEVLSPTQQRFTDGGSGEITIDLSTGNFEFQRSGNSSNSSGYTIPPPAVLPDEKDLAQDFTNYLSNKGLLPKEFQGGRSSVTYSGSSPADSQTADVSLWPQDINNYPIVTANYVQGPLRATVAKANDEKSKFIKVTYNYWPVDASTFSTYPLKTASEAFDNLKSGTGFICYAPSNSPDVSISNIKIGYFESDSYTPYLQPVYAFEGPGFAALVPAVKHDYQAQ